MDETKIKLEIELVTSKIKKLDMSINEWYKQNGVCVCEYLINRYLMRDNLRGQLMVLKKINTFTL